MRISIYVREFPKLVRDARPGRNQQRAQQKNPIVATFPKKRVEKNALTTTNAMHFAEDNIAVQKLLPAIQIMRVLNAKTTPILYLPKLGAAKNAPQIITLTEIANGAHLAPPRLPDLTIKATAWVAEQQ